MSARTADHDLQKARKAIAARVRDLRKKRRWTQAELARRLHLSQSRLSEIEGGNGSFTAEQFLVLLKLFNVGASEFAAVRQGPDADLQNVLARLGAAQLQESPEVLPSERLEEAGAAIREALVIGTPRLVTALAPALVRSAYANLTKLQLELASVGLERRLGWLCENTLFALRAELDEVPARPFGQLYRRAEVILESFLESSISKARRAPAARKPLQPDVLDANIRSKQSLEEVITSSSPISRRWGVVTSIQPEDFIEALRGARAVG
jgi:transcriptional regulator with XRE-family HTH domain